MNRDMGKSTSAAESLRGSRGASVSGSGSMSQLRRLICVQILNTLRLDGMRRKEKTGRFVLMGMLYVLLAVMLLGYCYMLAAGLGALGLSRLIPLYALTISSLVTIFFTFLKANGTLFGCRDYELLTALPVPTWVVISSRFAVLYLFNAIFSLGVMGVMAAAYIPYAAGPLPWLFWIGGILFGSLIPTTVASIAAALVAAVASRFRYSNAVYILLTMVLTFAILAFSFRIGAMDESQLNAGTIAALGDMLAGVLTRLYPPSAWFATAVCEENAAAFAAFAGSSILLYLVFAIVLSAFYQRIQNGLTAHRTAHGYKIGKMKGRSVLAALYQKEWKTFISSPVYVTNMGIGVLMAVAAAAAICFLGPDSIMGSLNGLEGSEAFLERIMLYLPVIILPMSNTACVSLSLEGRQLWILQSSPVQPRQIFLSKILVNLTIGLPGALLSSLFLFIGLHPEPIDALAMLLLSGAAVCLTAVGGVWINLKFPRYQWENQMQVVKQSAASMCGILGGLAAGIALTFVGVKFSAASLWLTAGSEALGLTALTVILWILLGRVKRLDAEE